jgi:hypothetical protein
MKIKVFDEIKPEYIGSYVSLCKGNEWVLKLQLQIRRLKTPKSVKKSFIKKN